MDNKIKYVNGKDMIVNKNNELDQYFTKEKIAKYLNNKVIEIISKLDNIKDFTWVEPSAGNGTFYDLLPKTKRIGIDIDPKRKEFIKEDYLKYELPNEKVIVIGNPPFGHRGVLALEFINHSKKAEYVCFILPMFFESKGKGSAKYRVKGFNLIHSEQVNENAFYTPGKGDVNVNCVFQIWSKNHKNKDIVDLSYYSLGRHNPFEKYIEVVTVSLAKKRECCKKWIFDKKADFYLTSTFYGETQVVSNFKDVKYGSGIAININTKIPSEVKKIKKIFMNQNWTKYSSLATNYCRHIGKVHIYELMRDSGFQMTLK